MYILYNYLKLPSLQNSTHYSSQKALQSTNERGILSYYQTHFKSCSPLFQFVCIVRQFARIVATWAHIVKFHLWPKKFHKLSL